MNAYAIWLSLTNYLNRGFITQRQFDSRILALADLMVSGESHVDPIQGKDIACGWATPMPRWAGHE